MKIFCLKVRKLSMVYINLILSPKEIYLTLSKLFHMLYNSYFCI